MFLSRSLTALVLLLLPLTRADVRNCQCDPARPETMEARECGLCSVAEKQPPDVQFFSIHDANPNKPNRWLVMPRFHGNRPQQLLEMTPEQRTAYWTTAIAKGREHWGEEWGLALNSTDRRTQCHLHLHVGKLLPGVEDDHFVTVDKPADIPVPPDGEGIWIHPVDGRIHAHVGEPAGELKLQR